MITEESKQVIEQFWATMNTNDFNVVGQLLHAEYVVEWPQSRERIRGRENFVAVNVNYPVTGRWHFTVHRIVAEEDQAVSEVTVNDDVVITRVITFSTIRDRKIIHQTEYWPDPFEAAAWRSKWVERY
jgi:limonene-1,2-epoxide hydrolase